MTTPEITALPDAPTPQDAPEVFNDKSFRLVAAQAQFVAEANALAGFVAEAAQAAAGADGSAAEANESALAARDVAVEAQEVAVAAQEEVSAVAAQFGDVAGAIAAADAARGQAEAASAGAGDSEAAAVEAKELAQAAKEQAELARDLSQAASTASALALAAKDTIALGRASVGDGVTFWVKPNATDGLKRYTSYLRTSAATHSFVADVMPASEFDAVLRQSPDTGGWILRDQAGRVSARMTEDSILKLISVSARRAIFEELSGLKSLEVDGSVSFGGGPKLEQTDQYVSMVRDTAGRVIKSLSEDGTDRSIRHKTKELIADRVFSTASVFRGAGDKRPGFFATDIVYTPYYGQSWAMGTDALPVESAVQLYDTLSFNGGVRQVVASIDDPTVLQSFEPAVESFYTAGPGLNYGEVGAVAMCDTIKRMIQLENNLKYTEHSFQLLVSAPGEGAKTLYQLADNDQPYMKRLKEQILRGYEIATAQGKTFSVGAVTWLQSTIDMPALEAMRLDISNYAKSITGQVEDVPLITWQTFPSANTAGHVKSLYDNWVLGANAYPNIICAGPSYQADHSSANTAANLHWSGRGTALIGRQFGFAFKRCVIDKEDYQPLQPVTLRRSGKFCILRVNVPSGMLVVDTDAVVAAENLGFQLFDSNSILLPIANIEVTGTDTIKITAVNPIPAGSSLSYAGKGTDFLPQNRWRGNIRDNLGDIGLESRWLVAFSKTIEN